MTFKKIFALLACAGVLGGVVAMDATAATKKKKATQSAVTKGTSVRAKVEAKGIYDQECYDMYYGCMDQFCIMDNINGGSCACSDASIDLEKRWNKITEMVEEAERIRTVEVEKVKAGADADIVFGEERRYDKDGNILDLGEEAEEDEFLSLFEVDLYEEEEEEEEEYDITTEVGDALQKAAHEMCVEQVPEKCEKDLAFLRQVYLRQISSDCKGFENTVKSKEAEAKLAMASAEGEVRTALKESLESANKYDRGQCMVEYKKCMMTEDACGSDWSNCVFTIASENMQNEKATSTAGKTVSTVDTYDITASTMEILNSKRYICEHVLDQCLNVRDMVWPDFLREAAPTIRVAESKVEAKFRQSCLTDISNCIQTACKDDIAGTGKATMDACLARPEMARSFCKVEIDPCERMEPLIWDYVVDKLASMRVDACTQEVKDCIYAEDRCGKDFQNCIGMDFKYIHDMCPIDKLVVCKQGREDFTIDDLDSMLMGLYLNFDNSALDQCQERVDLKMEELCGSTTDCNRFASDENIGAGSIQTQKDNGVYRVTGMISFGSIKMGDGSGTVKDGGKVLGPGEIGIQDYLETVRDRNKSVANFEGIVSTIEAELNNIAGTINRTISLIENDQQIQYCVSGRDLSQINGLENKNGKNQTTARFPNLLNQIKVQIASAALRQAQDNYNKKFNEAVAKATRDADVDIAQYMCQKISETGKVNNATDQVGVTNDLTAPFAITYDVAAGLKSEDLLRGGGTSVTESGGTSFKNKHYNYKVGGRSREVTTMFNRETRNCHVCTTITTEDCKVKGTVRKLKSADCSTNVGEPHCEDIQM